MKIDNAYTAAQFIEVLQLALFTSDLLRTDDLAPITSSHIEGDTLIVTIPNGEQFALVAHQMVPAAAVTA